MRIEKLNNRIYIKEASKKAMINYAYLLGDDLPAYQRKRAAIMRYFYEDVLEERLVCDKSKEPPCHLQPSDELCGQCSLNNGGSLLT